jgi:hypothetical protein
VRRLCVLLLIVAVSLGAASPVLASYPRDTSCWRTLVHDWYVDGKIDGRYRVSCYRAVLARVPADPIDRSVKTDVSTGLTVGIRRLEESGRKVGPHTLLPAPATAIPAVVLTAARPSHFVVSVVVAVSLVLLLLAWCADRLRAYSRL